jgi:hypothetical protein
MTPAHAVIENVSRRGFLKGLIATGGLVVVAQFVPARSALAAYATGVKVVQSPGDEEKYGNQNTDRSRSMPHFIQPMRQCGGAMRQMLENRRGPALGCGRRRGSGAKP